MAANWANRTVWTGDNLDIMRGLNSESVDLIYLDPPFNSNRTYEAPIGSQAAGAAFKDTWTLSDLDVAWTGYIADEHPAVAYLLSGAGMCHGKGMQSYLTMMAVRVLEMRRVLKPTGSLYLHCDPTASHYLKQLLDAVFGRAQFHNEITWKRTNAHPLSIRRFESVTDTILYYVAGDDFTFNGARTPMSAEQTRALYSHEDDRGRFASTDLSGGKQGGADAYRPFKGVHPPKGRAWAPPDISRLPSWAQSQLTSYTDLRPLDKCHALDAIGLIHWTSSGRPRLKRYLEGEATQTVTNLWADIKPAGRSERVGYPTQKPLELLDRIIKASSNPGDVVLDPFCGCATACVAAERLGREWVGIDLSPKAVELVNERLRGEMGDLFHYGFVTARTDIPQRTDIDAPKNYRQNRHVLYGEQEGRCNGCQVHFEFRHLTVDHIVPQARGGTHHRENLQLLCGHYNSVKGDRDMPYLIATLSDAARNETKNPTVRAGARTR